MPGRENSLPQDKLNVTVSKTDVVRRDNQAKANFIDNSKYLKAGQNQIFWQTFIENQRPKLRILINNIEIEGMVDTGVDFPFISPKSWPATWPLQEVDIQFQGVGTLSQIKQSTRWLRCTGPKGHIGKLRPYMTGVAINLWGRDLLQQWKTQINIPSVSKASHKASQAPNKKIKFENIIKGSCRLSRLSINKIQQGLTI